jgi:AcrR family transcriptional regulator
MVPKISLRERQLQLREDTILDAAHELMAEQGFNGMSMDDLAARVGISKATLYQHFSSKEELGIRVIVKAIGHTETFVRSLDTSIPAIQRLEMMLQYVLEQRFQGHRADLSGARLTLHPMLRCHPDYRAQVASLEAVIAALVEEAKAVGDIVPHLSTRVIVKILLSSARDPDYLEMLANGDFTLHDLKATTISILFDGLRATKNPSQP